MATITIDDETYQRLARKATAPNQTVDALVGPLLNEAASPGRNW